MQKSLVPQELLKKSDKILFITHLAIGDFAYMQNYFKEFAACYPHLKIDLWVDEQRGKSVLRRWKSKGNYVLYDWLSSCSFFNKIYQNTNSWWQLRNFFKAARDQNYPIVVCLVKMKKDRFAKFARLISPSGFVVGATAPTKFYQFIKKYRFKKLSGSFSLCASGNIKTPHITDYYANWFEKIFGLNVAKEQRPPFISIPKKWFSYAKLKLLKWDINYRYKSREKIVFINTFAKTGKRCWPMEKAVKLISLLRQEDDFYDANFVVNVLPDQYYRFEKFLKNYSVQKIFLFTASHNFFQLPAILSLCDLVISVETSVMHLAAALDVPVIALMRQKNPEWIPYGIGEDRIVLTKRRRDRVKDISVQQVGEAVKRFCLR